jgi:site-specific DNA recombinase
VGKKVEVIKANEGRINRKNSKTIERLRVAAYCRVSTDSEEQLESYQSQLRHYRELIQNNSDWEYAGVYADEGISGTQSRNRQGFQRMINDAMDGKIDLILTKSISRFARNTLDTLKYVRLLKEKGVGIKFEKENINTLDSQGEMLLTILSSLAQAESESISANVKMGLHAKMNRGVLVGFHGCLGYDYDSKTKTLTVNEKEVEIVKYIFKRYIEGTGCFRIAKELTELGYKTKKGNKTWHESSVLRIIKNEKYMGDVMMGKTFTVDPISKRRLENFGEENKYRVEDNHEPIISRETFKKAQEILQKRSAKHNGRGRGQKYSRKYAFSSMIQCSFCNSNFSRRTWHSGKIMWSCISATKRGRKYCPDSKHLDEKELEDAFVDAFNLMISKNKNITEEFLKNVENTLSSTSTAKELKKVEKEIDKIENNINKLIDLHLEGILDKASFEVKHIELIQELEKVKSNEKELQEVVNKEGDLQDRINTFRKLFEDNEFLEKFDREIFESVIDKVIAGKIDENGNVNPYSITFIFKTGLEIEKKDIKDNSYLYPLHDTGDVANKTSPCHIQKYYAGIKEKLFICRISSYNNAILYSNYSIE